ncbi:unnamed protein product [Schistosoma margrebowiei]|uniref:Major facilitator superfamily (MFS) profile domain-containing protein n=1 Tax=Schistosoma margrebowiei TaxID=48269 RepID=A0A3P8EEV3_9TREM|nr:unnamed protein product [Schistosoma margrebowiei]
MHDDPSTQRFNLGSFFIAMLLSTGWGCRSHARPSYFVSLIIVNVLWSVLGKSFLWLLMYRVLCGAARANVGVVSALVGDISSDTLRTKGMAVVGLAYGIGFTVGPPCSVILLNQWKVHTSTEYLSCILGSTCLLLNCINLLILIFALPSTLQKVCFFIMLYHVSANYSLTDAFVNINFFNFELNVLIILSSVILISRLRKFYFATVDML